MSNIDKQAQGEKTREAFERWAEQSGALPWGILKKHRNQDGTYPGPHYTYMWHAWNACHEALLDELEAKEKRIAELEAREVVLPQRYSMLHRVDFDEPYHTEMVYKQHQVLEALHDAGVNVAAAGKGE
ncbi:hypothetical protein ACE3IS_05815 [Enterobacter hormaechei subsp. hormaechei]|uniref:hypothetical protein n=1 Tax=Enterobacter hormaechei TaxID=158836 RepID=UPI0035C5F382